MKKVGLALKALCLFLRCSILYLTENHFISYSPATCSTKEKKKQQQKNWSSSWNENEVALQSTPPGCSEKAIASSNSSQINASNEI